MVIKLKKKYYIFSFDEKLIMLWPNILFVICAIVMYFPFFEFNSYDFGLMLILWLPYMISHELIHGLTYLLMGGSSKKICFGAFIEKGIFYCLHKGNIKRKNILTSLVTPLIILGIIAYIISLLINSSVLAMLSILNISGCIGDIIMYYHLVILKNYEFSEFDNPMSFALHTNEDLSKKKMKGLKFVEVKDKLEITTKDRLTITPTSWIFMILLLVGGIMYLLIGKGVL